MMLIKVMKMFMIKTVMIAITWSMSATSTTSATKVMVTVVLLFLVSWLEPLKYLVWFRTLTVSSFMVNPVSGDPLCESCFDTLAG